MKESLDQLSGYLSAIYRHRWPMFFATLVTCLLGWTGVFLLPDKYEATSKLLMSNESMMGPLLKGLAAESNLTREMASLMRRTLLSRPNLERVIDRTDLHLMLDSRHHKEELIRDLGAKIQVKGDERSKVYSISYIDEDPRLVTDVVKQLTNIFIEHSIGATRKDTSVTREFLDREIATYEAKLREAEERLKEFKKKNIGLMPSEGQTYFSQLNDKMSKLELARLELAEARKRQAAIESQLAKIPPIVPQQSDEIVDEALGQEIAQLRSQLENLRSQYTDEYPGIVEAEQRLNALLAQQQRSRQALLGSPTTTPEAATVIIESRQNLLLELSKAKGDVGALTVRVNGLKKQVDTLKKNVNVMPKVEAQLAQLDRDYDIIKETYEGLVQRREATSLSDQAETSASDFQFQVIEAPVLPTLPVSPDRFKLVVAVLLIGIGVGALVAVIISQAKQYVSNASQLKKVVRFPVYGAVTEIITNQQRTRRRLELAVLGASWALLLAIFSGLLYLTINNMNLVDMFSKSGGMA